MPIVATSIGKVHEIVPMSWEMQTATVVKSGLNVKFEFVCRCGYI